jgi:arylformamidase
MPFIDLSHTIENGLITYKGLPAPVICDYLSREESRSLYASGTEFQISKIEMVTSTGTYIDCPFHRYEEGKDMGEVALDRFVKLPGTVVVKPYTTGVAIGKEAFLGAAINSRAVLVCTGWDTHWNTPRYFEGHPYLTEEAAHYLHQQGALLVGIDSHNIDDTSTNTRPVHSLLLGEEILIVEHLCNLHKLRPGEPFYFTAAPPKFKGVGTFPVRAYAEVQ